MKSHSLFWAIAFIAFGAMIVFGVSFYYENLKLFLIITCFTITLGILFIWLYHLLIKPFNVLSQGIDLLKAQDFSSYLREVKNEEANKAVKLFNQMMVQLKEERLHVREQNHFLDLLINSSPLGFIILDFDEHVRQINPSGFKLLNICKSEDVIGKKLTETNIELLQSIALLKEGESIILKISGITMYSCSRSSFIDRGFSHPYIIIEELTHEILRAEKKSFETIIRMMAHEVNNSIASVSSTLSVINESLLNNDNCNLSDTLPAVEASLKRCNHLSRFIGNLADVVKIPPPSMSILDLNILLKNIENIFLLEFQKRNILFTLDLCSTPSIIADNIQLEQVLINIIKNACEAIDKKGQIRIITTSNPLTICIDNTGKPISKEIEEKLFTPFFTTKPEGQGIGLMFIREVLSNHGYRFRLFTLSEGWTRFEIIIE